MKKFSLCVPAVLLLCGLSFARAIPLESRISEVTVYPDSAFVTRTAEVKAAPGRHLFSFEGIVPDIDENSVSASAGGGAGAVLYGVRMLREHSEEIPSAEINMLQSEIRALRDEISALQNRKKLMEDKKRFLESRTVLARGGEAGEAKLPSPSELAGILELLHSALAEYYEGTARADIEIRSISEKIDVLSRRLSEISGPRRKLTRTVVMEVEVHEEGMLELSFAYRVPGASWRPSYAARADLGSSSVELVSYGNVRQRTGEDWDEAKITLSTARPSARGEMPPVSPWILRPYTTPPAPAGRRLLKEAERMESVSYDAAEPVFARAVERGTAINYELPGKFSINSDGAENRLPVSSQNLQAEFEYASHPARDPAAYLGGVVKNSENLQLLPGRVNIFMDGDFTGSSQIGSIAPGEEFRLPLGLDENVRVERRLLEKKVDETGIAGIPSRSRSTTLSYKISVENYKSGGIRAKIFEPVPSSEDDRIRVSVGGVSMEPSHRDWEDKKGVWVWEIELDPGEKKDILYTVTVTHPRNMVVEGL